MKTAPPMNTVDFITFCELHQLWQAVILKPLKLEECILHFWKSPIFINVVPTSQGHSFILNNFHPKDSWFHTSLFSSGVYHFLGECISVLHQHFTYLQVHPKLGMLKNLLWDRPYMMSEFEGRKGLGNSDIFKHLRLKMSKF